jgi:hypothetical protein
VDALSAVSIRLSYPIKDRVKAACGAVLLWAVAVFWTAFMLNVALSRPTTPSSGRPLALALIVCAVPFAIWGLAYWRRVIASTPELCVDPGCLTIKYDVLLRAPLSIPRDQVTCVAVDNAGDRDGYDDLRFPVVSDGHDDAPSGQGRWLYSRYAGAPMPILDTREALPNVAIVFKAPTIIEAARLKRHRMLQVNGGLHGLYRHEPALGLLLRVEDPGALHESLSQMGLLGRVTEGDLVPAVGMDTYPSLGTGLVEQPPRPVGRLGRPASRLGALALLVWLGLVLAHSNPRQFGFGGAAFLAIGVVAAIAKRSSSARASGHPSWTIPFQLRALVIYPAITSGAYALALLLHGRSSDPSANNSTLAYVIFPLAVTSTLVLIDASRARMASNGRLAWAIASSLPALALSGLAFAAIR